jgi:formyltetrahydrofolate-dependent phosphoribosylglycinamide formyltransferase
MSISRKRTVIMISGRGSNMASLIEAASERSFPAEIVGIVSDKADARGLHIAAAKGLPARIIARGDFSSKEAHDAAIDDALSTFEAEIVCLAGYMRLLTTDFVERWQGRMLNIHPALLPAFRGLDTHARALEAGMRIHGCTVHFVTAETDSGPIIAQAAVPVLLDDTEATLAARVLKAEHHLYPLALRMVALGMARMEGVRTVFADTELVEQSAGGFLSSPSAVREAVDLEQLARFTP